MKVPYLQVGDMLSVIISADKLFDGATVTKRTGDKIYTLKRSLKVYPIDSDKDKPPMVIEGCFLCDNEGSFNQISPTTLLAWRVEAQSLMWALQSRFDNMED